MLVFLRQRRIKYPSARKNSTFAGGQGAAVDAMICIEEKGSRLISSPSQYHSASLHFRLSIIFGDSDASSGDRKTVRGDAKEGCSGNWTETNLTF